MDFSTISRDLSDSSGTPMQLQSPDGYDMWAYQDGDKWSVTTQPETVSAECKPVRFLVIGSDSKPFRRRQSELFKLAQNAKKVDFSTAELEGAKTISAGIVGWQNVIWDGAQMEFTPDNVEKLLLGYRPAAEQADAFMSDRTNFFTSA